jgi:aspartyl-tRNA(Asn)/glutamyl-tRNA(Gln) amidotransferase subunit C
LNLSEEEVRHIADLANLQLSDEEVHRMSKDLGGILTYVDQLSELDIRSVEPMAQVLFDASDTATLREDVVRPPLSNADALANAAVSGAGYFKVPRVIER